MWAQADQENIAQVIFLQKRVFALKANIARIIFLCNVVPDVFGQHCVYNIPMKEMLSVNYGSALHR